jgi:hypothetical protein
LPLKTKLISRLGLIVLRVALRVVLRVVLKVVLTVVLKIVFWRVLVSN